MRIPVTSARAIFDPAVFGVALPSPPGDWQFLNDRFCEIAGHSRQKLLVSSERDIADDRLRQMKSYAGSSRVRFRRPHGRTAMSRKDETIVWAKLCVSPVRDHVAGRTVPCW